jgi:hypothetical protein
MHFMLAVITASAFYESLMNVLYYYIRNGYNQDSMILILMNWGSLIVRATMSRVVILATALGYHVLESSLE